MAQSINLYGCIFDLQCLYKFQTLYTGIAAIIAALITIIGVYLSARVPVWHEKQRESKSDDQRRQYAYSVLSTDLRRLSARVRQAEGTIRAVIAANKDVTDATRNKVRLVLHPITEDWEFMSVLVKDLFAGILLLRSKLDDHNFDMDRAGGAFGGKNFQDSILNRIRSIQGS